MATASALTELLSASAVDGALRLQLKAHPHQTLRSWGLAAPSRSVYFVEPGETPESYEDSETIIELPAFTGPLATDNELDIDELAAVAGGGRPYAEAVRSVRTAVRALASVGL
ncbi:MAG: hypothetical protein AAGI52_10770 [Bacteroidota bacterium]